MNLPYGLSEAVPESASVAWGARLIINMDGHVDLPPDRQGLAGDGDRLDLIKRMESACSMRELFERIRGFILDGTIDTRTAGQVTLIEDLGVKIVADTKASAGYLYVAAWRYDEGCGDMEAV